MVEEFLPVLARTVVTRRPTQPSVYDCVRFVVVREGSLILNFLGSQRSVAGGDVVLVAPGASIGCDPEEPVTATTVYADTDYLVEHLFWQQFNLIPDRETARDLATKLYPNPIQVLRIGQREVGRLAATLDELVALTGENRSTGSYFQTHALLFTILAAITPHIRSAPVNVPPLTSRQRAIRVAPPRWRAFRPIRHEIARTAALMQSNIARRWPLTELAAHACLSPSQLNRVFKESFGVTPVTYLSILRVQEMARLIRETDLPISAITDRVGWCHHCGQASKFFRRYMGVTPIDYRRYGPPSTTIEGPNLNVARAVLT